jgi:hypothetical protein
MIIPFGNYEPDKSRYTVGSTSVATNCLPVQDGWGPMPTLTTFTTALAAAPKGVTLVRTSTGGYQIYSGTTTNLYKLDTTATPNTWTDVTRAAGGNYAVPPGDSWAWVRFRNDLVALNLTDAPQQIDVDVGTQFAALSGSPPNSRFGWVAGDFFVLGYNSSLPFRVRWGAFSSDTEWTLQTRGAGLQDIVNGGEVQGGIGSEDGAIIMQRNQILAMRKVVNVSAAFDFASVLNPYQGTIAPYGFAMGGEGLLFYPNENGFFQGVEASPIGAERVDRWFFSSDADRDYLAEIKASIDPYNKICWFNYQKVGGAKALLGYNWQLDRWCYSDQNVSYITAIATAGITWDGLDSLYATIDDVSEPYDSRLFAGGRPTLAAFDSNNKLGTFTGSNAAVTLETADVQLVRGKRAFLKGARLLGDCSAFTLKVGTSEYPGGTVTWSSASSPHATTGICPFRSAGLFHRFRLEIPAGTTFTVVSGIETFEQDEGER